MDIHISHTRSNEIPMGANLGPRVIHANSAGVNSALALCMGKELL